MSFLASNLKYLRKQKGFTQDDLAVKLAVKRAVIGSYEEGRAQPKMPVLQAISNLFNYPIETLVGNDLSSQATSDDESRGVGSSLRVLSTVVDVTNTELITLVPIKASAGYLNGYADTEFIASLPRFSLPVAELSQQRTYRIFQIKGDSMLPILPGSYIICEYLDNWFEVKDRQACIVVTCDEGIVFKRVYNRLQEKRELELRSDNSEYETYSVQVSQVLEVWKAVGYLCFQLPVPENDIKGLTSMVLELREELDKLKRDN